MYYRVDQKSKPVYAVDQLSIFLAYMQFETGGYIVIPINMVYVTALPCKILSTTLLTFVHDLTHSKYERNLYFRSDSRQSC